MKEKVKEATAKLSGLNKVSASATEVVKSFEKGFRESVKPTWIEWQKDVRVSTHSYPSAERRAKSQP